MPFLRSQAKAEDVGGCVSDWRKYLANIDRNFLKAISQAVIDSMVDGEGYFAIQYDEDKNELITKNIRRKPMAKATKKKTKKVKATKKK